MYDKLFDIKIYEKERAFLIFVREWNKVSEHMKKDKIKGLSSVSPFSAKQIKTS